MPSFLLLFSSKLFIYYSILPMFPLLCLADLTHSLHFFPSSLPPWHLTSRIFTSISEKSSSLQHTLHTDLQALPNSPPRPAAAIPDAAGNPCEVRHLGKTLKINPPLALRHGNSLLLLPPRLLASLLPLSARHTYIGTYLLN